MQRTKLKAGETYYYHGKWTRYPGYVDVFQSDLDDPDSNINSRKLTVVDPKTVYYYNDANKTYGSYNFSYRKNTSYVKCVNSKGEDFYTQAKCLVMTWADLIDQEIPNSLMRKKANDEREAERQKQANWRKTVLQPAIDEFVSLINYYNGNETASRYDIDAKDYTDQPAITQETRLEKIRLETLLALTAQLKAGKDLTSIAAGSNKEEM
jgi:hypothetical protein